jgi:UDP-N-acetylmuramate dehydrogenase
MKVMTEVQQRLQTAFPEYQFQFDLPLAEKSYFKIGGPAEVFFLAHSRKELESLLDFVWREKIPFTVLGSASNVLIAQEGIKGLVLQLALQDFQVLEETSDHAVVRAEVGLKTNQFVVKTSQLHLTGMEGFIGVPGTLGGALYNNAHYLGFLIADHLLDVEAYDVELGQEVFFSREKGRFAYEHSIFQERKSLVILAASFSLPKADPVKIRENMREAQERRQKTQPLDLPSSGCFFQNPSNTDNLRKRFPQFAEQSFVPAGFLIDQVGLKGYQIGDIQVSPKHAAFLVNLGKGNEKDVKKIVAEIKQRVKDEFGVVLHEEVFYLPAKKEMEGI